MGCEEEKRKKRTTQRVDVGGESGEGPSRRGIETGEGEQATVVEGWSILEVVDGGGRKVGSECEERRSTQGGGRRLARLEVASSRFPTLLWALQRL